MSFESRLMSRLYKDLKKKTKRKIGKGYRHFTKEDPKWLMNVFRNAQFH